VTFGWMSLSLSPSAADDLACVRQQLEQGGLAEAMGFDYLMIPAMAEMEDVDIRRVVTHGQKAAAYMADGHARVSHRPGIGLAQTIGSASLAAGLRDAYMAGSPVIALTGGVDAASRYKHVSATR
jgi:acetolactate synthase-1/2/3 large subunit